jgi:serine protease AprX
MKKILLSLSFIVSVTLAIAQQSVATKYWVYFADKAGTPHSKLHPETFLSPEAIARRNKMGIPIKNSDLPVSPTYIAAIKNTGAAVIVESRWLNAVSIEVIDETILAAIIDLPFVNQIEPVQRHFILDDEAIPTDNNSFFRTNGLEELNSDFGGTANQNRMIDVDFLHGKGYRGQGIKIAVLDGGFYGVDFGAGFNSVRNKNQILEVRNFPDDNDSVYFSSTHGSNVLSIMAVDEPGKFIGSAPDAEYYLFRTEIVDSERVVEEDFWLEAAEYADFIGADIINSSLGYTTFDEITEDHTYADMDGNTTVITKAADMAAAAGILVCNSAGNSGDDSWNYIGAPADGDSVFTIGAVDLNANYVSFSSEGPTSDGRIKPNVAGQGAGTAVMDATGVVYYGNGTSYSSPLVAGACASFMSAFPELTNMQVMDIIQSTASQANNPDNYLGYGIPNFAKAYLEVAGIDLDEDNLLNVFPNLVDADATIYIQAKETGNGEFMVFNLAGQLIYQETVEMYTDKIIAIALSNLNYLSTGMYLIALTGDVYSETQKLIIK